VPADLIARSGPYEDEFRMGCTIRRSDAPGVRADLERTLRRLDGALVIEENVGKVSLVGMGLINRPEYAARLLAALAANGITTSWIATSQQRISVIVPLDRLVDAVHLLHAEFGLGVPTPA
jgi:aspartate kinase